MKPTGACSEPERDEKLYVIFVGKPEMKKPLGMFRRE
jgi:hypothetical protein